MKKQYIEQLIEATINSADNSERATPKPFLLTRVNARLVITEENIWEKAVSFIGRPAIAIPGLAMVMLINVTVIVFKKAYPLPAMTEQTPQAQQADDFSYAVTTLYDIENTEP